MSTQKMKNMEKINIRDIITIAIIFVLIFVAYTIGAPIGFMPTTYMFIHAFCSLMWGTIFLLLYTKVNKKGVPLIISTMIALVMLMFHWVTPIFIFAGGVLGEIIWRKMDRKSTKTMTIVFMVQVMLWYIGAAFPMIFMVESLAESTPDYQDLYMGVNEIMSGPLLIAGIVSVIICTYLGAQIGKKLLKKHFEKAGIV